MSDSHLPIECRSDGIVVLHLIANPAKPRGGVVVLDAWLVQAIDHAMQSVDSMDAVGFLLVSDSERVFVAGADLAEIDSLQDNALLAYLKAGSVAFRRISSLRVPSACVIHKAALGGGLELAMHCDALIGVTPSPGEKSWKIGQPECGLHICPGWGGTVMPPARMDPVAAIAATMHGVLFDASSPPDGLFDATARSKDEAIALAAHWIHAHPRTISRSAPRSVCDPVYRDVVAASIPFVRPHTSTAASIAVLDAIGAGLKNGFDAAVASEQKHLVALRHTPEARAKLEAFLKRT